jgi:hypothetical protein
LWSPGGAWRAPSALFDVVAGSWKSNGGATGFLSQSRWTSTCSAPREVVMKTPQADGSSEPLNATEKRIPQKKQPSPPAELGDNHIGATEDQVSDTQAPSGEEYKDEPKQG